jgi:hypothetical protein
MLLLLTESKFTPAHAKKACVGRRGTAPQLLHLGSGGRWESNCMSWPPCSRGSWVGHRAALDVSEKTETSLQGLKTLHRPAHSLVWPLRLLESWQVNSPSQKYWDGCGQEYYSSEEKYRRWRNASLDSFLLMGGISISEQQNSWPSRHLTTPPHWPYSSYRNCPISTSKILVMQHNFQNALNVQKVLPSLDDSTQHT